MWREPLTRRLLPLAGAVILALPALPALPAAAQDQPVDELARDLSRVESVRAVSDLQRFYAHYAQFGLWDEMAQLFAAEGRIVWGDRTYSGQREIARFLRQRLGGVRGMAPGALHAELVDDPLINLSVDGESAEGRWMMMTMAGDGRGRSLIEGGIFENAFVREGGTWKIGALVFSPQYTGDYERGWSNAGGGELPQVPYHFTIDESGVPIPPAEGPAPVSNADLGTLETRIAALNIEDTVRNLHNAWGYYVDRRMWDDVADLFTAEGVVESFGQPVQTGREGVLAAMQRMGPAGLAQGDINDHPLFGTLVTVLPGNRAAVARSIMLGQLGEGSTRAQGWSFSVVTAQMVEDHGLWKIRHLQIVPLLEANYADGWGRGGTAHVDDVLPAFAENHPVTGTTVSVEGMQVLALPAPAAAAQDGASPAEATDRMTRLVEARRRLRRSAAYDGVVNVSSAYGYYIDDFQWHAMAGIFALPGNKHSPFAGFYLGQDRILAAVNAMYGPPGPTRPGISFHWRFQPVIHVSHDGRSANLRTRLFQPRTSIPPRAGETPNAFYQPSLFSGMYPNDQLVIENGIWRLWSLTIDEPYMTTAGWRGGWEGVEPVPPGAAAGQSPLVQRLPPDILMTTMGRRAEHFRGGTGTTLAWPDILPMWFHYKNPVSGRVPDRYWPDSMPSLMLPESRMVAHGYQMPPNGPEVDGIHVELTPPEANVMRPDGS